MQRFIGNIYKGLRLLACPVRRNFVFFVFVFILISATRGFEGAAPDVTGRYRLELFFDLYVLCALLCLLRGRARKVVRALLYVAAYAVVVSEAFIVQRFHLFFSPVTLQLLLETNPHEAGEFLEGYLFSPALAACARFYGPILVLNVLAAVFFRPLLRLLRVHFRGVREATVALNVAVPLLAAYAGLATWGEKREIAHFMAQKNTVLAERTDAAAFYSPFHRVLFSLKYLQVSALELRSLRQRMHHIEVDSCDHRVPNIVLIIGESYNKHHSAVYGYPLNTTPWQSKFVRNGSMVAFSDVITPWNVTSNVFKNLMSTHSTDQAGSWNDGVLWPALFRRAGYRVAFLSTQFYKSINLGPIDFNGSFFLNDPELDTLCFDHRNRFRTQYDRTLVRRLDDFKPGRYNLIIFHGMGQHLEYKRRFPASYARFTTADYAARRDLSEKEKQVVADYDNATLYNDEVVARVCSYVKDRDACVIYLPDHGEEVYDELHTFGRDHAARITPQLARNEFEVPMEIWFSPTFRRRHREIVEAARAARHRPFSSDDLPHMLMGLAGLHCPYYDARRDLLSPQFDAGRRRLLKNRVDYDHLMAPTKQKQK